MSKTWTKSEIIELLKTNDRAIGRALIQLAARQTTDERQEQHTKYHNGRGFRPCHARMGTSMADFFQRNGYLTAKQAGYWRVTDKSGAMRIGIYAGQLLDQVAKSSVV